MFIWIVLLSVLLIPRHGGAGVRITGFKTGTGSGICYDFSSS
jgi:hypothetical protein